MSETPMTDEQLDYFSDQTRRAVHKAVKRFVRGATVGFVILAAGLGGSIYASEHDNANARKATVVSGRAVAVDGCNRDFDSADKLRGIIIRLKVANDQSYAAHKINDAAHDAAVSFYTKTLNGITYPDCSHARNLITDNPGKTVHVPVPRNSSDAQNADIAVAAARIANGG